MFRTAVSKQRNHSNWAVRFLSQSHSNTPIISKSLPLLGFHDLNSHRYLSGGLNGHGHNGLDARKFTHEVKIIMPDIEDGLHLKGKIQNWYKKKGDLIKKDDVLCDIETEMCTFGLSVDDDYDSIMGDILVPKDSAPVSPGTVICTTFNEGHGDDESN